MDLITDIISGLTSFTEVFIIGVILVVILLFVMGRNAKA